MVRDVVGPDLAGFYGSHEDFFLYSEGVGTSVRVPAGNNCQEEDNSSRIFIKSE